MVAFEPVVQILGEPVFGGGQERTQRRRIAFRLVARDADRRPVTRREGALEEGVSRPRIPTIAQVHVDDLPVLVEAAEDVTSAPTNLEQGLIHPPARADRETMLACGLDEAQRPLGDLRIAQAKVEVSADGDGDHLCREAVAAEGRPSARRHPSATLAATVELALGAIPSRLREPFARAPTTPYARLRPALSGPSVSELSTTQRSSPVRGREFQRGRPGSARAAERLSAVAVAPRRQTAPSPATSG
jgi:hypothetical protein